MSSTYKDGLLPSIYFCLGHMTHALVVVPNMTVELGSCMLALPGVCVQDEAVSGGKPPQEIVWIVC